MDEEVEAGEPGERQPRRGRRPAAALLGTATALVALLIGMAWAGGSPAGAAKDDCHTPTICVPHRSVIEPKHGGLLPDEEDLYRDAGMWGVRYTWHSGDNAPAEFDIPSARPFLVLPACTGHGELRVWLVGNHSGVGSLRVSRPCDGKIHLPAAWAPTDPDPYRTLKPGEDLSMHVWIEVTGGGVGVCYFLDEPMPNIAVPFGTGPASPGAKPSPQPWPTKMTPLPPGYRPSRPIWRRAVRPATQLPRECSGRRARTGRLVETAFGMTGRCPDESSRQRLLFTRYADLTG
jgi:hypothetical protein